MALELEFVVPRHLMGEDPGFKIETTGSFDLFVTDRILTRICKTAVATKN